MAVYNISESLHGRDGGDYFNARCPTGEIVSQIKVRVGTSANQICATCSGGKNLGCHGGGGGSDLKTIGTSFRGYDRGYYNSIWGRQGNKMDQLMGIGGDGGDYFSSACPSGNNKYVNGIYGYSGTKLNKIGALCGVEKVDFCTNYDLEDSICSALSIDNLNKACTRDFSKTCRNKIQQLYEPTVKKFCKDHPTDDLCSCYAPPPPGLPDIIGKANPRCWNRKCATSGYKPPGMAPCNRSITICKQQLGSAGGDSNLFTGNVQVLECNSKPSGAGAGSYVPSATPPYTGGSDAAQIINDINKTKESIFDKKTFGVNNKILLAIMAIVLILLYITDDEEGGENYRNPIGYVQPNYNTYRKY